MELEVRNLSVGYAREPILEGISFSVSGGETLCLLGPNGVGKTTLFRGMLGFLKPLAGSISIDGRDMGAMTVREIARQVGYVPQSHTPPFAYSVIDVVTMGRVARIGAMASPSATDTAYARSCLEHLGIDFLADKLYTRISGGERQMVLIARALAQQPSILIMDEPTASLDYGNQVKVLRQISRLTDEGLAVVMTSHFPDHAFLASSKVGLITRKNVTFGAPDDVVTERSLRGTYGVDVRIIEENLDDVGLLKSCVPVVRYRNDPARTDDRVH